VRLLFLLSSVPYPPNEGIKLINYHLLRELSVRHEISVLALSTSHEEEAGIEGVRSLCRTLRVVPHVIPRQCGARLGNLLSDPAPFCVRQHANATFGAIVRKLVAEEAFDAVHVTYTPMAQYGEMVGNCPRVLALVDCMSQLFASNGRRARNPFVRCYWLAQARKMRAYERDVLTAFHGAVVVTEADRVALPDSGGYVQVIPNGVDSDYFCPQSEDIGEPSVIFRGILNFLPNVDAAQYLYKDILPIVRQAVPRTRLILAGRDPIPSLRGLVAHDPHVTVTGSLEDIRPVMAQATVHTCPMRGGSGIKNKLLEAMAMGKAVVTTSMGLRGVSALPDREVFVADDPGSFARAVIRLLKEPGLRLQVGNAARDFVLREHTWMSIAGRYEKMYREARKRHADEAKRRNRF